MLELHDVRRAEGMDVTDPDGNRIGRVETIYLDNQTDRPEFALVNTGMFGTRSSFVPLAEAELEEDHIRVPHSKDQVKDAPRIEADDEISEEEEAQIYDYYGLTARSASEAAGEGIGGNGGTVPPGRSPWTAGAGETPTAGEQRTHESGTDAPSDEAMTRSEEEIHVGKTQREAGQARLRKYVETEPVRERVETRHEEARVEREPITEENIDEAMSGPEISEEEHEVTLHEEEPVVEKRTVPKERVRMEKEERTEQEEISDEVRKERIETEEDRRS